MPGRSIRPTILDVYADPTIAMPEEIVANGRESDLDRELLRIALEVML